MRKQMKKTVYIPLLVLICIPLTILFLSQLITLQSPDVLTWFFAHWNALLLGWVLLFCICGFLYAVTGRLWAAWLIAALPCVILALISLYKTQINGAPLLIGDFSLVKQFGEIASFAIPQIKISLFTAIAAVIAVLVLIFLIWLDRRVKQRKNHRLILGSVGLGLAAVLLLTGLGAAWSAQVSGGASTQAERVKNCGVLVGLFSAWAEDQTDSAQPPNQELRDQIGALQSGTQPDTETGSTPETPTVIFLMSESFFDVTELSGLEFETDPIPNFHRMEDGFTSGKFVSSTYCGGTGYVEMEVLTGICSHLLKASDTLTSLPDNTYQSMPCITDVFQQYGYQMEFLHSYNNELYNRAVIYDAFGFDSVRFSDSFPADAEKSGGYLSDMALAGEIVSSYENKGDAPMMLFAVSMENHQPYTADKYGEPSGAGLSSEKLTAEDLAVIDAYTHGLIHADQSLGYLTEYFSGVDEPVMIVFWGDHLPNLGLPDGSTIYEKLGRYPDADTTTWEPDVLMNMLSTDYIIWTNYDRQEEDTPVGSTLLGLQVLEQLGFELTDYYRWLSRYVAEDYIVYRPHLYVDGLGTAHAAVPEAQRTMIADYASVVYDVIYGDNQLFRSYRTE